MQRICRIIVSLLVTVLALVFLLFLTDCFKTPEDHARIAKDNSVPVEKRLKSVRALDDQVLLADVAVNGGGWVKRELVTDIQIAAVEKLTDQRLLADIAKNNKIWHTVTKKAVARLTDERMLEAIAKNAALSSFIRHEAIARINDEILLARVAKEVAGNLRDDRANDIARVAVEKLTDQQLLAGVARGVRYGRVPVKSFSKLADQLLLSDLALHAEDGAMRVFAVEKLTDQALLATIAQSTIEKDLSGADGIIGGSPEYVRNLAVEKLTDQQTLAEIALRKTEHLYVRRTAIRRIREESLMEDIVRQTKPDGDFAEWTDGVFPAAERHLAKLRLLARIIKSPPTQLDEARQLVDIVASGDSEDVRTDAMKKLVPLLSDQNLLADIVRSTLDKDIRTAAMEKLTDQTLLANIAESLGNDVDTRISAVARLTDQRLLADIAKKGDDREAIDKEIYNKFNRRRLASPRGHYVIFTWWNQAQDILAVRLHSAAVRRLAVQGLADRQLLADVAKNAADADARESAVLRLDDQQLLADIAKNDADAGVARFALDKLTPDSETLARLARAPGADIRLWAVWRMADGTLLGELSRNDTDVRVRKAASEKQSGNFQPAAKGNIMTLMEEGKILVEITGNPREIDHHEPHLKYTDDAKYLRVEIIKLVPWPLEVIIPAGSHFVYKDTRNNPDESEYRSMISTTDVMVSNAKALVPVAFADLAGKIAQKDVPNSMRLGSSAPGIAHETQAMLMSEWTVFFSIRRHPNEDIIKKLMTHPDWKIINRGSNTFGYLPKLGPGEMQAAILIVTTDTSHDELSSIRVGYDKLDSTHMAGAMRLCAEADIDIKAKAIWRDREQVLAGLKASELRDWLENHMQ
jgi:hypothetical protein